MNVLAAAADLNGQLSNGWNGGWTAAMVAAFAVAGIVLVLAGCRALGRCRESVAARYTAPRR
jgi:hypothetical protein